VIVSADVLQRGDLELQQRSAAHVELDHLLPEQTRLGAPLAKTAACRQMGGNATHSFAADVS